MHTYDPNRHVITFGGIIIEPEAFGTDEFIRVQRQSEAWDDDVGVGGEVTRSKINDDRATATITLMQTSRVNDLLSAHYNLDRATPGGLGGVPFLLADLGGTTKIFAEEAWIRKAPDQTRGKKAGTAAWEIRLANVKEFHGGND